MIWPIAISLSPNTEPDDVGLALRTLISPWVWFDEKQVSAFEKEFAKYFGEQFEARAANSGRSAQYLILKALGIGKGDEVLVQAFTCVAVANSVSWTGAVPVYVDIDETYNLDPGDLVSKISKKTKALIVQHTFGIGASMERILAICKAHKLTLIEDCAHGIGAEYQGKRLGTLGDVAFFSLGRDKAISSVFGGMMLYKDKKLAKKITRELDELELPTSRWVFQQLFHPLAFSLILPLYNMQIGKALLYSLQRLGLLSFPVDEGEKLGGMPEIFPSRMPGGLAGLASKQFGKLSRFTGQRRKVANYYRKALTILKLELPPDMDGASWLRFPIQVENADNLLEFAKKKGIILGNWYRGVVMPVADLSYAGYKLGSCPKAEKLSRKVVNLPTYPRLTEGQARKVVEVLKEWLSSE